MAERRKAKRTTSERASHKKPVSRTHWTPSERLRTSAARIVGEDRAPALARHAKSEGAFLRAVVAEASARAPGRAPRRPVPQERYMAAAYQLPFALFVIDPAERFAYVNRAAEILTGRSRTELLGHTMTEALAAHSRGKESAGEESLSERLSVIVERARSAHDHIEYEVAYTLPSGARFDVGFTATLVDRPPLHREECDVVVLGRDLHMRGEGIRLRERSRVSAEVEADLRRRLRQVERQMARSEKLMAIGQMAAGFVHELNNPLGALQGLVQLLQTDVDEKDPAAEVLTDLAGEIEHIERITDSMLELARSSAGDGARKFAPVDVVGLIDSVLRLTTPQLRVKRVRVERELAPDEGWVLGDADRIEQLMMNLILNASQAMSPEGRRPEGGRLTIRVLEDEVKQSDLPERPSRASDLALSLKETGAEADASAISREAGKRHATASAPPWHEGMKLVRVEVEDTGPGIPKDVLGRLFEPFFTTKPPGEGTGLGLSTSEAIVRAHGGTIHAENLEGVGARFTVRLPACERPEAPGRTGSPKEDA